MLRGTMDTWRRSPYHQRPCELRGSGIRVLDADFRTTNGPVTTKELAADGFGRDPRFPRGTLSNHSRALFFLIIYAAPNAMKTQPSQPVAAAGAAQEDCVTSERKGTPKGVGEIPETQRF